MRDAAHNELRQLAVEAQRTREREDAEAAARRNEADRQAREQREQAQVAAESAHAEMSQQLADLTGQRNETLTTLSRLADELAKAMASTAEPASEPAGPDQATAESATAEPATTDPATPRTTGHGARPNRSARSEPRRPSRPAGASDAAAS